MNKHIINAIFLLFVSYYVKGDANSVQLNEWAYLPPFGNKLNNGILPPANNKQEQARKRYEAAQFHKESYKYNKPGAIDDPLPMRVDYVQPLGLDFASGQYKPIFKGELITGLFFNENVAQLLNRDTANEATLNNAKTTESSNLTHTNNKSNYNLNSLNNNDSKAENTIQLEKYVKNPVEDVVPINYYVEKIFKYKLFNYDDDTALSNVEPVVIFKPGDDIRFTEDTSIIDNYEHMFSVQDLSKQQTSASVLQTTTIETTPAPVITTTHDTYSTEATKQQPSSAEKTESNATGHGYIYEKPKISFTF